jgi:hypothetical protein
MVEIQGLEIRRPVGPDGAAMAARSFQQGLTQLSKAMIYNHYKVD